MAEQTITYLSQETLDYVISKLADILDFPIEIEQGGTGATDAATAWTRLGGGSVGKLNLGAGTIAYLRADGKWAIPPDTTYDPMIGASSATEGSTGLVPAPEKGLNNRYLRSDGVWAVPPDNNTDVNVKQTNSTAATAYPILTKNGTGTGEVTSSTLFSSNVTVTPSTGTVTATTFKGVLDGNAATATKASTADTATKATSADTATKATSADTATSATTASTCTGNAATATKLAATKSISVKNGNAAAGSANFDGSQNVTITVSNLDASTLTTGTVPLERLPQGALERIVDVADQAARFKLTTATVQLGDTVRQLDTGIMYVVVDESKLSSAAGYVEYAAGTAAKADYATNAGSATSATTATSAGKLTTSKNLGVALGTSNTTGAAFDGSANQLAIPVSGTLGIGNGGTGATTAPNARANLEALGASKNGNAYYGMVLPDNDTGGYVRTTKNGLIPIEGNSTTGSGNIGTSGWPFASIYAKNFYGAFNGTATNANLIKNQGVTDLVASAADGGATGSITTNNAGLPALQGISMSQIKNGAANAPESYGNVINIAGSGAGQIFASWPGTNNLNGHLHYRAHRDADGGWSTWATMLDSVNYNTYVPGKTGTGASGTWGISITGNAATATSATSAGKWTTAKTLGGISVDGSANRHWYATCPTEAATAAKVATVEDSQSFTLGKGAMIFVKFTNANTVANPTLNVNNTGAKNIYRYGTTAPSTSAATSWQAGSVVCLVYDGSYWQMVGWLNDNTNTDTKVTETVATDSAEYPILTKNTTATATITDTAKFAAGVTINPSSKTVTATTFKGNLTGNVTGNVSGSSGSCTGNAATATSASKLTSAVSLAGKSFNGSAGTHWYGTCTTAAATAAKEVTDITDFTLATGAMVLVKMTNANTVANPTLNVNKTGAKNIYRYGTTAPSTSAATSWNAGSVVMLVYDGTYWQMVGWLDTNTTYGAVSTTAAGLAPKLNGTATTYLNGAGQWTTPPNTNTWTAFAGASASSAGTAGYVPAPGTGNQNKFFRGDGTWQVPTNTTYSNFGKSTSSTQGSAGLVPAPAAGADNRYLRNDGTWAVPPDNNTTYAVFGKSTSSANGTQGLVPAPTSGADNRYLRNDGTWQVPPNTNTDTNVTQTITTTNADYRVLFSNTADDTTRTEAARKASNLKFNPSTGNLTATTFTGNLTGSVTGNVTGSSGSCTGNAATASKATQLTNARNIDGISFNGTAKVHHYGVCSTADGTAAKTVTLSDSMTFTLETGAVVYIKFTNGNTATTPTLNVNSKGAKTIVYPSYYNAGDSNFQTYWGAGATIGFIYDGTNWNILGLTSPFSLMMGDAASQKGLVWTGYQQWKEVVDLVYPVGAIYISYESISPASVFGGTWTAITTGVLRAAGANGTGGSDTHTHGRGSYYAQYQQRAGSGGNSDGIDDYHYEKVTSWASNYRTTNAGNVGSIAETWTNGMTIGGTSASASTLPAYQNVYAWRRTA